MLTPTNGKPNHRRLLIPALAAALALAVALPALGAPPHRLVHVAAKLSGSSKSANKSARKALKVAKGADKRSKTALALARSRTAKPGSPGPQGPQGQAGAPGLPGSSDVPDGSISAAKLANDAVTAANIAADAVGSSEIATDAVGSSEIATDAVGSAEIQADAVTSSEIAANTIGIGDIAQSVWSSNAHMVGTLAARPAADASNDGFLYFATDDNGGTLYRSNGSAWAKAARGATESTGVGPDSVTATELANNAVVGGTGGDVQDDSLTAADLATDSVVSSEIATDAVGSAEIEADAVTSAEIAANTVAIGDIAQSVFSSNAHAAGTLAARPAASSSNDGFLYFATDDAGGTLYRSDGITWVKLSDGVDESIAQAITFHTALQWSNQPSALTELAGYPIYRARHDLTHASEARLTVNVGVAGAATPAKLRAQYSTDQTTWNYLDGSTGPSVDINTTGFKTSSWVDLDGGAKADVFLRIVGIDGNATADPYFGRIDLQVK